MWLNMKVCVFQHCVSELEPGSKQTLNIRCRINDYEFASESNFSSHTYVCSALFFALIRLSSCILSSINKAHFSWPWQRKKKQTIKKHRTETLKNSRKIISLCFKFKMNVLHLNTFYKAIAWVIFFSFKKQIVKGP